MGQGEEGRRRGADQTVDRKAGVRNDAQYTVGADGWVGRGAGAGRAPHPSPPSQRRGRVCGWRRRSRAPGERGGPGRRAREAETVRGCGGGGGGGGEAGSAGTGGALLAHAINASILSQ